MKAVLGIFPSLKARIDMGVSNPIYWHISSHSFIFLTYFFIFFTYSFIFSTYSVIFPSYSYIILTYSLIFLTYSFIFSTYSFIIFHIFHILLHIFRFFLHIFHIFLHIFYIFLHISFIFTTSRNSRMWRHQGGWGWGGVVAGMYLRILKLPPRFRSGNFFKSPGHFFEWSFPRMWRHQGMEGCGTHKSWYYLAGHKTWNMSEKKVVSKIFSLTTTNASQKSDKKKTKISK